MSWADVLTPGVLPFYASTLAQLALAVFLLAAGKGSATRALAAYLILVGISGSMEVAAPFVSGRLGAALAISSTLFLLPLFLPLLWLASSWPAPRGPLARTRWTPWLMMAAGGALVAAAIAWPRLLVTYDAENFAFTQAGPLFVVVLASVATPGFVAWILARDLASSSAAEVRSSRVLAVAFTFMPLWRGVLALWLIFAFYVDLPHRASRPWLIAGEGLVLCSMLLGFDAARRILADARRRSGRFPTGLAALFVSPLVLAGIQIVAFTYANTSVWSTIPFTLCQLFLPVVATYGLMRGGILGLDLKVRFAISKSTVAAIFIAAFFIASEAAQQFFSKTNGAYFGIGIAGTLVFAMAPLQRAAEKLAEKAVPGDAVAPRQVLSSRGEESYRTALRLATRDRVITVEEDIALAQLAEDLGIGAKRTAEIRHEVAREMQRKEAKR